MARKAISQNRPWVGGLNTAVERHEAKRIADACRAEGKIVEFKEAGHGKVVPVCYSPGGRNSFLKNSGGVDYDGGYGDHTG